MGHPEWPPSQLVQDLREAEDSATNSAVAEAGRAEGLATLLGVIDGLMAHARPLLAPVPPALKQGHQLALVPPQQHEQQQQDGEDPKVRAFLFIH